MKVASSVSLLILSVLSFSLIQSSRVSGNATSELLEIKQNPLTQSNLKLGYIQTASRKIEIKVDNTYTIYNQKGKIVQENITLETLKAENPDLYKMIERAIADETLMMYAH